MTPEEYWRIWIATETGQKVWDKTRGWCKFEFAQAYADYVAAYRASQNEPGLQMCKICHQPVICCPDVPDPEAAHLQTIDERDHFEETITKCAIAARCPEEWSSNHEHGDCIVEEIERLRGLGEGPRVSQDEPELLAAAKLMCESLPLYSPSSAAFTRKERLDAAIRAAEFGRDGSLNQAVGVEADLKHPAKSDTGGETAKRRASLDEGGECRCTYESRRWPKASCPVHGWLPSPPSSSGEGG